MKTVNEWYVFLTRFILSLEKTFLLFHMALLKCLICSRVGILDCPWVQQFLSRLPRIRFRWFLSFDQKKVYFLLIYWLLSAKKSNHKKYHAYLNLVYSICHRFDIYRLVKLLTSTFWYTGSKLSTMNTTTWRLPHSSLINISLGKSTKFPIPSIAFSIITTLTKE